MTGTPPQAGEIILYTTEDRESRIQLRAAAGTVWLTQKELAELFETSVPNINLHIQQILADEEVSEATVKDYLRVRFEGSRRVSRNLTHYNLDMILAVGYRVRSLRGVQFRRWANSVLKEYLIKGFALDDARLKEGGAGAPAGGVDYFEELLARIRDIRVSEKRFYQKIRDLYVMAVDYDKKLETACVF